MEPCGTPHIKKLASDLNPLLVVYWTRLERYDWKKLCEVPRIPHWYSLSSRILWLTQSKALDRSKKIDTVCLLDSILLSMYSFILVIACVVEWDGLNPNWLSLIMLNLFRYLIRRLEISFSNSFEITEIIEIGL